MVLIAIFFFFAQRLCIIIGMVLRRIRESLFQMLKLKINVYLNCYKSGLCLWESYFCCLSSIVCSCNYIRQTKFQDGRLNYRNMPSKKEDNIRFLEKKTFQKCKTHSYLTENAQMYKKYSCFYMHFLHYNWCLRINILNWICNECCVWPHILLFKMWNPFPSLAFLGQLVRNFCIRV